MPRARILIASFVVGLIVAGGSAFASVSVKECEGCHGSPGLLRNPEVPFLYGQDRRYLIHQMTAFQKGFAGTDQGFQRLIRKHPVMSREAPKMELKEIPVIAEWFSRRLCRNAADIDPAPAKPVAQPARAAFCMTCHGRGGRSTASYVPKLAGQRAAYLRAQLYAFRDSKRPDQAEPGRVRSHRMMSRQGSYLTDADIDALAAFFSGQSCR